MKFPLIFMTLVIVFAVSLETLTGMHKIAPEQAGQYWETAWAVLIIVMVPFAFIKRDYIREQNINFLENLHKKTGWNIFKKIGTEQKQAYMGPMNYVLGIVFIVFAIGILLKYYTNIL